jgi:hypothetical protein
MLTNSRDPSPAPVVKALKSDSLGREQCVFSNWPFPMSSSRNVTVWHNTEALTSIDERVADTLGQIVLVRSMFRATPCDVTLEIDGVTP